MKIVGSRLLLIAAAVGLATAATTPAFAWTCTAKAGHASYLSYGFTPGSACWHAMNQCQIKNAKAKGACKVVKPLAKK